MLVVGGLLIMVLTEVGLLTATLRDEETWSTPVAEANRDPHLAISGSLTRDGEMWTLELQGEAAGEWLVVQPDGSAQAVRLDQNGRLALHGSSRSEGLEMRVVSARSPALVLRASVAPTPFPMATAAPPPPTATHKPSAAPRPGARTQPVTSTSEVAAEIPQARTAPPPILHLVPDAGPKIALTFDGGMSSNGTLEFLDFLNRSRLRVTLFLTGQFIAREPGLVRRVVLAGHEVGNHTYTHLHLTSYGADHRHRLLPEIDEVAFKQELRRTEEAFFEATGRRMAPLWRSPYGEENRTLRAWALELGYLHVRWSSLRGASLDSRDWVADEHSSMYEEPRRMMERLMGFPHLEGGIVLMHLSSDRIEPPWTELPLFLSSLKKRGIEPVKVTELLEASRTWRGWLGKARRQHVASWGEDPMTDE